MKPAGYLKIGAIVTLLFALGLAAYDRSTVGDAQAFNDRTYDQIRLFSEALSIVQKNYVEEPETRDLVRGAIEGMLRSLDPHSSFMDPDMFKEMQIVFARESDESLCLPTEVYVLEGSALKKGLFLCDACGPGNMVIRPL